MSNIRIGHKKVLPASEPCEVCRQPIDKTITVFRDKIEFVGDELDLNQGQFNALKQILLNAATGFMKALMEAGEKVDAPDADLPKIPKGAGKGEGFTAVPPASKEPPVGTEPN